MSIPGGPVHILTWSPVILSCALFSGHPYPCSSSALLLLNGVGSYFRSCWYSHCLLVIPADSFTSSRRLSHVTSCSLRLTIVLRCSLTFYDDGSCSTYTSLPLYYFLTLILCNTRYLVASKSCLVISKDVASLREHLPLTWPFRLSLQSTSYLCVTVAGIGVIIFPVALRQHPQLHLGHAKIPKGLPWTWANNDQQVQQFQHLKRVLTC